MSTIAVEALTKRYGTVTAVDAITFQLAPGRVTGFLGPNGAGKSTTMRMLLGLARPTSGRATINGRPYAELRDPLRHVGALIDPNVFHPGRSGRTALRIAALPARIPGQRVEEVLHLTGLGGAAHRRAGGYSQGMRQRLALAAALLGDPETLILDEPATGLDPDGVHWLRGLLRRLATEGRTVFVSSHLLAELAQTVDDVVIINQGRLVAAGPGFPWNRRHFRYGDLDLRFLTDRLRPPAARACCPPGAPRAGWGRPWACPRFLPEGPQRSPGSGPARRAAAQRLAKPGLEAGGAAPYPARRSGRTAAAKPPPPGRGPRGGPAAVTRPHPGPGPAPIAQG